MHNRLRAIVFSLLAASSLCSVAVRPASAAPKAAAPSAPGAQAPAGTPPGVKEYQVSPGLIEDTPATKTIVAPGYNSDVVANITSDVVDRLWAQTDVYWHQGDYPRIIELDKTITQLDPYFMEPYSTGGWLMESMGDLKDAEAYYRLGLANNPNNSYLYYNLAAFYFNTMKDYQSAANVMKVGVNKKGSDAVDWGMLAHADERSNHIDDAISAWETLLQRFPKSPNAAPARNNLARLLKIKNGGGTSTPPANGEISL